LGCPTQKEIDPKETTKKLPQNMTTNIFAGFEADNETLVNSFVFLKRLLQNMHPSKKTKMPTLLNNMKRILDTLGLSHDEDQCVNEFRSHLFHTYLKYVGDHLYKLQMTTHYCEVLEPTKTGTAHEKRNPLTNPSFKVNV
jgi:hypothetical protein